MKSNQKGIGVVEVLIVMVVMGLTCSAAWLVYDRQKSNTDSKQTNSSPVQPVNKDEDTPRQEAKAGEISAAPSDWITYQNDDFGFSFDYPSEYGKVTVDSSYGSENQNALLHTFYFEKVCPVCNTDNPFSVDMASDGIVEIGATTAKFGGIGTGRPYASSAGFSGEGNFQANGTNGLLKTTTDDWHKKVKTTIEFNLTRSSNATGIMFMTHDEPGETTNAQNLIKIAETFKVLP